MLLHERLPSHYFVRPSLKSRRILLIIWLVLMGTATIAYRFFFKGKICSFKNIEISSYIKRSVLRVVVLMPVYKPPIDTVEEMLGRYSKQKKSFSFSLENCLSFGMRFPNIQKRVLQSCNRIK